MDPITLATVTSAVCVLATEAGKSMAGEVGKSVWEKIKGRLGFKSDPTPEDLPVEVAHKLRDDAAAAKEILQLLRSSKDTSVTRLVGRVDAEKVIVQYINKVEGGVHIAM